MEYRKYYKNQILTKNTGKDSLQLLGMPLPPIEKSFAGYDLIPLHKIDPKKYNAKIVSGIINRESVRKYKDETMSFEELSLLLYSTQGVKKLIRNDLVTLRTVPSGGGMHPFETYLLIKDVENLDRGLYRYIATKHSLVLEREIKEKELSHFNDICFGQTFVTKGNVIFIWTARPERTEWRYGEDSLKDILISAGHICQNLYLASEEINAGTCAIVAYDQKGLEKFINVDGESEIAIYLAPVGKR